MARRTLQVALGPVPLLALTLIGVFVLSPFAGCNRHVFDVVPRDCTQEEQLIKPLEANKPADILVVIDNSGSMCEEQANLIENFFDPDCPIDVNNVQPEYLNPDPDTVQQLAASCGFIQLLAAYDNDWRLGVITSDVGQCDNRYGLAENGGDFNCSDPRTGENEFPNWGRRPQRGCLQPFDLGAAADTKVLQRGDADVGTKFASILENTRTFGSAFERGLDAMEVFLDPDASRAPGCGDDLGKFVRPEAKLVVIFVSDEDDCSHADGEYGFPNESADESCDNATEGQPEVAPSACYDSQDQLSPVNRYTNFLRNYKGPGGQVAVAVIAGALKDDQGAASPAGCIIGGDGTPQGGCFESGGNSNLTFPGFPCDPAALNEPCCQADPGSRYFQLADQLGGAQSRTDSICFSSFRGTMLDIAAFIAAVNQVQLDERPASPGAIIVQVTKAGETEPTNIPRIADGDNPSGQDGWQYDGDSTITFYGNAIPQPGDEIFVAARSARETGDAGYVCGQ
jgi:hypothetical protein